MSTRRNAVRTELRYALHDELATIRAINSELRLALSDADRKCLTEARTDALIVVRSLLTRLYPRKENTDGYLETY